MAEHCDICKTKLEVGVIDSGKAGVFVFQYYLHCHACNKTTSTDEVRWVNREIIQVLVDYYSNKVL